MHGNCTQIYANERKMNGHECTLEKHDRKMKGYENKLKDSEMKLTGNACKMKLTSNDAEAFEINKTAPRSMSELV